MEEIKKREYPQEMLLMGGCPNCGQEVNRQFVEKTIDDIVSLAVSKERERIVDIVDRYFEEEKSSNTGSRLVYEHIAGDKERVINLINTK